MTQTRCLKPPKPPRRITAPRFFSSASKIIALLMLLALAWPSLKTVPATWGLFDDTETSPQAIQRLGTLDFITATTTGGFVPSQIVPDQKSRLQVDLINAGNLPFQYDISVEQVSGDENVCEFMQMEAYAGGILLYRGGLINFATSSIEYSTSTAEWSFNVSFPSDALGNIGKGKNCQFKIKFTGWQLAADNPRAGFFDDEEINGQVQIMPDLPKVTVAYPNGGEHWYIVEDECVDYEWCSNWCVARGMNNKCEYEILWDAQSGTQEPKERLKIDIWYSTDSGQTWLAKIADGIPNNGKFYWKIPFDLSFVSDKARIKVVATDKEDPSLWGWDESDADFCPPMLSIEDLINRASSIEMPESASESAASTTIAAAPPAENLAAASAASSPELPPDGEPNIEIAPMSIEEINRDINQVNNSGSPSDNGDGNEAKSSAKPLAPGAAENPETAPQPAPLPDESRPIQVTAQEIALPPLAAGDNGPVTPQVADSTETPQIQTAENEPPI